VLAVPSLIKMILFSCNFAEENPRRKEGTIKEMRRPKTLFFLFYLETALSFNIAYIHVKMTVKKLFPTFFEKFFSSGGSLRTIRSRVLQLKGTSDDC
jgi:hypothetical protein